MSGATILPHGGTLVNRWATDKERQEWLPEIKTLKRIHLTRREISDLEMIGVGAFAYIAAHLALYVADQSYDFGKVLSEIVSRVYLIIGMIAWLGLAVLAATSTDGMVRRLGGMTWRRVHQAIYVIGFLALIVGIVSFLAISGLALSMTIGASRSPGTMAITGVAGLLSVVISVGLYITLTSAHGAKPSTWDWIGTIIAFTVGVLSSLSLGGVAVVMTMGAFMPNKQPITSWPAELEQTFAGFERRNAQSQSQAP